MLLAPLLVVTGLFAPPAVATTQEKAPPPHAKVVVIGIDGVSLNLLEPFAAKGAVPNLAGLMKDGARGHLDSIWPLRTPQVWTSVVTGKLPGQHGIWDHKSNTYFYPPELRTKEEKVVTSADRRSKALWNILDEKGVRTLTVGWVASWPAEPLKHGVMAAPIELFDDPRQTTIKGSFWRGEKAQVTPDAKWPAVRKRIVEPGDLAKKELAAFADLPAKGSPVWELPYLERYAYGIEWSLARAKSVEAITTALATSERPEVVMAYFQCPDSLLHRFWIFQKPVEEIRARLEGHGIDASRAEELKARFGGVVEACYRDVDARVGRILEAVRGPDTRVLVVSDHGFGNAKVPHQLKSEPYSGDHLDEGVILAAGPGIAAGSVIEGASVLDVTPTVLQALGLPVGGDMRGKVLGAIAPGKAKTIPSYEKTPQTEVPHAGGWPARTIPPRPTAAQMPAKRFALPN